MILENTISDYINVIHGGSITGMNPYYDMGIAEYIKISETFTDTMPSWFVERRNKEPDAVKKKRAEIFNDTGNPIRGFPNIVSNNCLIVPTASNYKKIGNENTKEIEAYLLSIKQEKEFWKQAVTATTLDPMGAFYVLPNMKGLQERNTPMFYFAKSENVIDLRNDFACIKSEEYNVFEENSKPVYGNIFYFFSKTTFVVVRQISSVKHGDNSFLSYEVLGKSTAIQDQVVYTEPLHGALNLPVFRCGHILKEQNNLGQRYFESIISDSVPDLRTALENYFDAKVESMLHIATEAFRATTQNCKSCGGTGRNGVGVAGKLCGGCNGEGKIESNIIGSGFSVIEAPINTDLEGFDGKKKTTSVLTGFAGEIPKERAALSVFEASFQKHFERAFYWVRMEYIFGTGNSKDSAESKRIDKEDSEQFFLSYSDTLCRIEQGIIDSITAMYFYYDKPEAKKQKTPTVIFPNRFNLESSSELFDNYIKAKDAKLDISIQRILLLNYSKKEFGAYSNEYKRILTASYINPMFGLSGIERALIIPTLEWWQRVLSDQIYGLIFECESANFDFLESDLEFQKTTIENLAKEKAKLTASNQDKEYIIQNQIHTKNALAQ